MSPSLPTHSSSKCTHFSCKGENGKGPRGEEIGRCVLSFMVPLVHVTSIASSDLQ